MLWPNRGNDSTIGLTRIFCAAEALYCQGAMLRTFIKLIDKERLASRVALPKISPDLTNLAET